MQFFRGTPRFRRFPGLGHFRPTPDEPKVGVSHGGNPRMSSIVRALSPEVPEPPPGTWSNCLVVAGIAYLAGMTSRGEDEYVQARGIFAKIRHMVEAAGGSMA